MRANAVYILTLTVITALLLTACGGSSGNTPTADLPDLTAAIGELAAALPAVPPGGPFNPHKISAEITAGRTGDQATDHSAATVTLAGAQAQFHPGAGELGWALYVFSGSPADEIAHVEYDVSNRDAGNLVYVAISNYTEGTWEYFGARNQDAAQLVPTGNEGDYASEAGRTYVAVFAFDGGGFDLDFVRLTYANRYLVSGQVVDRAGVGVPQCLITTTIGAGGGGVLTEPDGTFTLPAIPDGSWHLMATKPGWVFFNNPETIIVSGGPLTGVQLVGEKNLSHFDPIEDQEPNDTWWEAPNMDPAVPVLEFLSASDDPNDYYRFAFTTPGQYYFRFVGEPSLMFPYIELLNEEGKYIDGSSWIYSGSVYVGFTVAATRVVHVHVSCSGGGGEYQLGASTGDLNALSGMISSGGNLGYIKVKLEAGGDLAYMFTSSGAYGSDYMQPVNTTVTPDPDNEDMYAYTPASTVVDLSLGDDNSVDFAGSALLPFENYEPNDDSGTAYDFGALPLTSHNPVRIGGSGGDMVDWYKFQPAAGKDIIVNITYDYTRTGSWAPFTATLYDSTLSSGAYGFETDTGLEVRSNGACDGNDYYLSIYCWDGRYFPYTMTIEEFDGYTVEIGGLLGSFGVVGAVVDVYDFDNGWTQSFQTGNSGRTEIPFRFMDGETVYVEFFRYGLDCDRYTDTITVAGGDELVWFRADEDESADRWEPNNSYGKLVDYPLDTDATISGHSDSEDKYIFTPLSTDPLHIVFDTPADGQEFDANLVVHATSDWVSYHYWTGDAEFLLPTNGVDQYRLEITSWSGETSYHITIDESPGYMLTGTVLDVGLNPVTYTYVYSPDTDQRINVWDGNYELGPFMPGSHEIYVYATNYAATPASPWTANFTSADINQNFVLNINNTDANEPDDDWTQATVIPSGVPMMANVTQTIDSYDWYKFTAGPGLINVNATFNEWAGIVWLSLYDTDGSTELDRSWINGVPYQRIDYLLPAPGTYYVRIYGNGNDYALTANY